MIPRKVPLIAGALLFVISTILLVRPTSNEYLDRAKTQLEVTSESFSSFFKNRGSSAPEDLVEMPAEDYEIELFPFVDNLEDQLRNYDALHIAPRNVYRKDKGGLQTPLFIAFGRNWFMLQQCVVSYLAAGWPASDITVFDNSGTMAANQRGQLSIDNPAYVNVSRLQQLGVNYERTPALLTFSQLQNFFLSTAMTRGLDYYFWGHMDVVVLSKEDAKPYKSFYESILEDLRSTVVNLDNWVLHFYNFDWLTLINVKSMDLMGAFDTSIPYYTSDCDFYSRVTMWGEQYQNGFALVDMEQPFIFDSLHPIADLSVFFPSNPKEGLNSARYMNLYHTLVHGQNIKGQGDERNRWQNVQQGGHQDPYFKGPGVQDETFRLLNDLGRSMFENKWHTGGVCPAFDVGRRLGDMYAS